MAKKKTKRRRSTKKAKVQRSVYWNKQLIDQIEADADAAKRSFSAQVEWIVEAHYKEAAK